MSSYETATVANQIWICRVNFHNRPQKKSKFLRIRAMIETRTNNVCFLHKIRRCLASSVFIFLDFIQNTPPHSSQQHEDRFPVTISKQNHFFHSILLSEQTLVLFRVILFLEQEWLVNAFTLNRRVKSKLRINFPHSEYSHWRANFTSEWKWTNRCSGKKKTS